MTNLTHLSYDAYQKLCENFGKEKMNFRDTDIVEYLDKFKIRRQFRRIDMNVILSKEFIELLFPLSEETKPWWLMMQMADCYYRRGMPAVEVYILSLL